MTSLHPAITRAAMLYDERDEATGELRKLEQFEQDFLTEVSLLRTEHSQNLAKARSIVADNGLFNSVKFVMDSGLADELTQALERYDAANEAQDAELEYLLGVVAEEMEVQLDAAE